MEAGESLGRSILSPALLSWKPLGVYEPVALPWWELEGPVSMSCSSCPPYFGVIRPKGIWKSSVTPADVGFDQVRVTGYNLWWTSGLLAAEPGRVCQCPR